MSDIVDHSRRQFLSFAGKAGLTTLVAQAVGINLGVVDIVRAQTGKRGVEPFRFAIISDAHLYSMPDHKFDAQLADAVAQVNAMTPLPDFVLFGGDVAQNGTEDQLVKGKKILSELKVPLKLIPGEHDWYLDMGDAWRGLYGDETWSFNHKGVHFIGLNSTEVSRFPQATSPMTAAMRGFRVPWPGSPQSTPKPTSARSCASARRTSAKAYSVRRAAA